MKIVTENMNGVIGMKKLLVTLSLAATAICQADPVQVSVTGTADTTTMGYTAGQSYTFNWVVNDGYTGGSNDDFDFSENWWFAEITADPLLLLSVSGDGLDGAYVRPSGQLDAPREYLRADSNGLDIVADNDDQAGSFSGLTVNGVEVRNVATYNLDIGVFDYSHNSFVNPADWLASNIGTYTPSSGNIYLEDESGSFVLFSPTSATIEAIPEPATFAFVGIFGGGLWFIRRYFPSV